jgi:hypothetical protein
MYAAQLPRTLANARRSFQRRMRGSCTISRPDESNPVTDPDTLEVTYPETPIFEGPCYVRYPGLAFEQNPEAGGSVQVISRLVVRIPFGLICRPGDVVTILSDPDNPQLVGTKLRVASIDDQSQATAQRLLCEDHQQGPIVAK